MGGHGNNPTNTKLAGTGADDVSRLAAIGAEATVVSAAAFFEGKVPIRIPGTVIGIYVGSEILNET